MSNAPPDPKWLVLPILGASPGPQQGDAGHGISPAPAAAFKKWRRSRRGDTRCRYRLSQFREMTGQGQPPAGPALARAERSDKLLYPVTVSARRCPPILTKHQ